MEPTTPTGNKLASPGAAARTSKTARLPVLANGIPAGEATAHVDIVTSAATPTGSPVALDSLSSSSATTSGGHVPLASERDPELDALVREIIARIADKWTMLVLETLEEHGKLRFTQLGERIGGVSQKMLTKTVRQMEADGLVVRTVYPVIPPRVDYELTEMGRSLGAAFCGVWIWAEQHRKAISDARAHFAHLRADEAK